jgi:hypothetical protein
LKLIYYLYDHSNISYGLIFWGNSSHSNMLLKIQKELLGSLLTPIKEQHVAIFLKKLNILPLQSQYILSLAKIVVGNFEEFSNNTDIHSFNTRQKSHLHLPSTRMTKFQKGVHYMCVKIFNILPPKIQHLSNNKK